MLGRDGLNPDDVGHTSLLKTGLPRLSRGNLPEGSGSNPYRSGWQQSRSAFVSSFRAQTRRVARDGKVVNLRKYPMMVNFRNQITNVGLSSARSTAEIAFDSD
jgi:hypothetical protein